MIDHLTVRRVIINTLNSDATYAALVTQSPGLIKTFGLYAPEGIARPYTVIQYWGGGTDLTSLNANSVKGIDQLYLIAVEGVLDGQDTSAETVLRNIAQAIHNALHMQPVIIPAALTNQITSMERMKELYPYEDTYLKQNFRYVVYGGVYTVQLETLLGA